MDNHLAGAALVAWLLLAPLVGVLLSSGWNGRGSAVNDDNLRR